LEKGKKNPKAIFCIKVKISAFQIRIVFPTEERFELPELHVSLKMRMGTYVTSTAVKMIKKRR
jgi:hypothetical protein